MVKISPPGAGGGGPVPGRGAKIPDASGKNTKTLHRNMIVTNKDFKNGPHKTHFKKIALQGNLTLDILHGVASSSPSH